MRIVIYLIVIMFVFVSCGNDNDMTGAAGNEKLYIVATTGMIRDAILNIAGDVAEVAGLMGPGVDPHLYKATQGDLLKLNKADIIFYNGLHLEGKMGEVLEKLGRQKKVVAIGEGVAEEKLLNADGVHDPHIWFDVSIWREAVKMAGDEMIEANPENKEEFAANLTRYLAQLDTLHEWVKEQTGLIPERQRVLITAHDAFEYFGRAYGMKVRGLQGISTVSEYGLQDITSMVDYIVENNIKAVFVESSVSEKALNAVVEGCAGKGHDVKIGGTLYSDAMGADGTPEGTYIGMVKANVNTIVSSLK